MSSYTFMGGASNITIGDVSADRIAQAVPTPRAERRSVKRRPSLGRVLEAQKLGALKMEAGGKLVRKKSSSDALIRRGLDPDSLDIPLECPRKGGGLGSTHGFPARYRLK